MAAESALPRKQAAATPTHASAHYHKNQRRHRIIEA